MNKTNRSNFNIDELLCKNITGLNILTDFTPPVYNPRTGLILLQIRFELTPEELKIYRPDGQQFFTFDSLEKRVQQAEERAQTPEERAQTPEERAQTPEERIKLLEQR